MCHKNSFHSGMNLATPDLKWVQIKNFGPQATKQRLLFEQNLIHSSVPISDLPGDRRPVSRVGHKQELPQGGFFPLSKSDQKL